MCSSPTCVVLSDSGRLKQQEIATISSEIANPPPPFFCEGGAATEGRCCPMPGILPAITRSHDIAEETPPPPPPSCGGGGGKRSSGGGRSSGWKTSKFFSRTMSSGEILRGLKKLSLTSSSSEGGGGDSSEAARPRKSKSGQQLKKRSSAGNDDGEDDPKARSPGSFRPLSKAMSVSEPGGSSSCRSSSSLGIVCRKEDLKAILCTAGKKFPLASPSSIRRRHKGASPLRQTKSASFDTQDACCRKEPVRRAGSEEAAPGKPPPAPLPRSLPSSSSSVEKKKDEEPPLVPPTPAAVVAAVEEQQPKEESAAVVAQPPRPVVKGGGGFLSSTVKWDECEEVDAVVLGDAIESFLKGSMGGGRKAASSFKRTADSRKAKSDG